jgi:RimJ/RimL family protein N-acetyltransferase
MESEVTATETAQALLACAFDELAFAAVKGSTGAENHASKRVMEKIGMCMIGWRVCLSPRGRRVCWN